MKQTNLLFCVLSFLLFAITGGCNGSQKSDVLGRADSILDHHPDSALKILQAINADSLSGRKDKARYGLLLFAALTKIGNQPETDSILKPALSFYGKGKTPSREKMLTHFFHANFLVNNDKLAESIVEYDKAINIGEAISDTLYPALGYISKGVVYGLDCIGKEELENTLEGMKRIILTGDTPKIINAVHNYGLALVHNLKYKEANTNLKMALDLAEARKDTANIIDIKLTLASSHQYAGDNRTSAALYEEAFKLDSTLFPISDYGIWGLASVHTGDIKNAEKCLSVISGDLQSDIDSIVWYNLRCRLAAARGDYKSALALKDSAFSHSDRVVAQQFDFNLLHSEKQFLNEKSRLNAEIAQQKERLLIISVISAILLIVSSLLAIYIINNKRKHKISIQQQEIKRIQTLLLKNEERIFEKGELIANLEKTIAELRDRLSRLNEESRSLRDDICRKENELNIRNEENSRLQYINDLEKNFFSLKTDAIGRELSATTEKIRDLEESMEAYRSLAVSSYRKANLDASQILADMEAAVGASRSGKHNPALEKLREELNSDKAFARIYQEVDCLMENVMSKISAEFNPEPKSKLIILLTLAGFGYRGIATITGMNPSTVSSMKTRLTGKILKSGSEGSALYEKYL